MVVIFGASHVNVWVAFIGFFLPFVVAFTSRNAACLAFLETQDCIGHNSSSFLRRVISQKVTVVTMVTVFLGYPLPQGIAVTITPTFFHPKPQGAGWGRAYALL
jgi:hypothetical protein